MPEQQNVVVLALEKNGGNWTTQEIDALTEAGAYIEGSRSKPNKIVLMGQSFRGTIEGAVGHSNFAVKRVDYLARWE